MEAYLDYNSTTPVDPRVFEAMKPYLTAEFGNASSFHRKGQAARNAVESARERIADFLGVEPGDIFFTSGGTEADNLAVKGAAEAFEGKRKHLVVSAIEHQAVLFPAKQLEARGFRLSIIPVDVNGVVDMQELKKAVTSDTALVSIMHANNETGSIQPVTEAARIAHERGALFHTDAVQSLGKINIDLDAMPADLLSLSAHKVCGPKGAGALYVRKGVKIKPQLHGGHQEKNIRPGTENVAAIAGFGKAVELLADAAARADEVARVRRLRDKLFEGIHRSVPDALSNGDTAKGVYNTLNLSFPGLDGETLLMNLDLKNICTSTGSACTAGSVEPSHVLLAMGLGEARARAAVRFSLGRFTTDAEIDYALKELPAIVERLRKASTQNQMRNPYVN